MSESTLRVYRGDSAHFTLTCTEDDGSAMNLTDLDDAALTVRTVIDAADVVLEIELGTGLAVSGDPTLGLLALDLAAGDTNALEPGDYRYDVEAIIGDDVFTITDGMFMVKADVTRPGS